MPHMTGTDFAKRVRADWPSLPILLATGYAELPEGSEMRLPTLSKPFGLRELTKGIDEALAGGN
jgi:CheY-like chemotaxis protein